MSQNESGMKGNWNKCWEIAFGDACGALKGQSTKKQDYKMLFGRNYDGCILGV